MFMASRPLFFIVHLSPDHLVGAGDHRIAPVVVAIVQLASSLPRLLARHHRHMGRVFHHEAQWLRLVCRVQTNHAECSVKYHIAILLCCNYQYTTILIEKSQLVHPQLVLRHQAEGVPLGLLLLTALIYINDINGIKSKA